MFGGKNSRLVSARVPYRDDYVVLLLRLHAVNLCERQRLGACKSSALNKIMLFSISTKKNQTFTEHFSLF